MPAFLARHYDVPTEVERGDEAPASFIWRGRRHVVREVLGHWWQTGAWWERLDSGVNDDEREVWRGEAGAARPAPGVGGLGFAWAAGGLAPLAGFDPGRGGDDGRAPAHPPTRSPAGDLPRGG